MRQRSVLAAAAVAVLVLAIAGGCNMSANFGPTPGVWALNISSNSYLVRIWTPATGGVASRTWALPAGTGGFVAGGRNMEVEVLDRSTCSLVASRGVSGNVLVSVDVHGRVDFYAQPDAPAMNVELIRSTECDATTPPAGVAT